MLGGVFCYKINLLRAVFTCWQINFLWYIKVMQRKDYENSVVLLGPKGVGKSLISSTLAEKLGIKMVVSTDFLRSILIMYDFGVLRNFNDFKNQIEQRSKQERINPLALNQKELIEIQKRDIDAYFKKVYGAAQVFFAFKQNKKFDDLLNKIRLIKQIKARNTWLSNNGYNFLMQYFLLELVEMYLSSTRISEPIVLDMGADLGVNYTLTQSEFMQFAPLLNENYESVINKQKNLIEKFKMRVMLVPGEDYFNNSNPKIYDADNKNFLNKINDYIDYCNITVSANGLSYNNAHPVYKTNGRFFVYEDMLRDQLKDKSTINNICDQIVQLINDYKKGERKGIVLSQTKKR